MSPLEYLEAALGGLLMAAVVGVLLTIPTVYLAAREAAKLARKAMEAGREDVARQMVVGRHGPMLRPLFRFFLPRDLREKFPEA